MQITILVPTMDGYAALSPDDVRAGIDYFRRRSTELDAFARAADTWQKCLDDALDHTEVGP